MTVLGQTLAHLTELVAADTQNPPRDINARDRLFVYLTKVLERAGFTVEIDDLGAGAVNFFATRGSPRLLFNVHLDTVPAGAWSRDPRLLVQESGRAIGLGAADTKGAAACLLAVVEQFEGDAALLFTTDEEAGDPRCVQAFLRAPRDYDLVIVAEPTGCLATLSHRGMGSAVGTFTGVAGHGSAPRALLDSAVHEAVRWASRALDFAAAEEAHARDGLYGIRFNLGVLEGGSKANVIAGSARVRFAVRSRPGEDPRVLLRALADLAPDPRRFSYQETFLGPTLPVAGSSLDGVSMYAKALGLPLGGAVDFWSEASLFAGAGLSALVFGPGHIEQAHTAGEWVELEQLEQAARHYQRLLETRVPKPFSR